MNKDDYLTPTGRVHELKTWPSFWQHIESGAKPFEVRRDDRGFAPGDLLHLREWDRQHGYTGRSCYRMVTYLLDLRAPMFGVEVDPPLVVLGLRPYDEGHDCTAHSTSRTEAADG